MSSARAAAKSKGELQAALTKYQEVDWKKRISQQESDWKSKEFGKQVGLMGDTLSLANTLYGAHGDKMSDVAALEKEHGKMQGTKDYGKGPLGKFKTKGAELGRSFQLLSGQGNFTFGEGDSAKKIAGRDISTEAGLAKVGTSKPKNTPKSPNDKDMIDNVNEDLTDNKVNANDQLVNDVNNSEENKGKDSNSYEFTAKQNTWLKKAAGDAYAQKEGEGNEEWKSRRKDLWAMHKSGGNLNDDLTSVKVGYNESEVQFEENERNTRGF